MNLEKWTDKTGQTPLILSAIIITMVSLGLGIIIYRVNPSWGLISGLAFGISGFLLVILPNAIMLKRIWNDEIPFDRSSKNESM